MSCRECKSKGQAAMWRHPAQGNQNHCPFESFSGDLLCTDKHVYVHVICASQADKRPFLERTGLWLINPSITADTDLDGYKDFLDGGHRNELLPCEGIGWQEPKPWV